MTENVYNSIPKKRQRNETRKNKPWPLILLTIFMRDEELDKWQITILESNIESVLAGYTHLFAMWIVVSIVPLDNGPIKRNEYYFWWRAEN